jgi:branched-chain amino acid transport system ATP-binding protein
MSALLEVRDLEVGYGQARALNGVTFDVPRNSLMTIIGSNGAGKTSLIRAIAGMLRPSAGQIRFDGDEISGFDSNRTCEQSPRPSPS